MNLPSAPEPQPPASTDAEVQYRRLRMLTQATAFSVLILTGTVFIFLYRQVVLVRRQTAELARYIAEVDRSGMPGFVEQVRDKFNLFRKDHPDFNPIYTRYFGTNEPQARARASDKPSTTNQAR
jgi:hypothetical protein